MKEIFLLKLGEIVLKGSNKRQFESKLRSNVRRRLKPFGEFDVYLMQSTIYVEPMNDEADVDGAWEACKHIFGIVNICRCRACEKNLDAIFNTIEEYLGDDLDAAKSFKVESRRADKQFPRPPSSSASTSAAGWPRPILPPRWMSTTPTIPFLSRSATWRPTSTAPLCPPQAVCPPAWAAEPCACSPVASILPWLPT